MEKILEKAYKKTLKPATIVLVVFLSIALVLFILGIVLKSNVYFGIAAFALFFGVFLFPFGLFEYLKSKKILNSIDADTWKKIEKEMEKPEYELKDKVNELYITKNYLISFGKGFEIIEIDNIVWAYDMMIAQNGINTQRHVLVFTEDKKKHQVAFFVPMGDKHNIKVQEILEKLGSKSADIMIGYTQGNRKSAKELYGIK